MIYRGYFIEQVNQEWLVLNGNRKVVQKCKTEDATHLWIDNEKLRGCLRDCVALMQVFHTRETTGQGMSYYQYSGQVKSTIDEANKLLET